jgi:hypothetical protein
MLSYIFLFVAIAVMTYLIQFQLFGHSRNKVLPEDFTEIIDPALRMDLSAGTR